MDRRGEYSYEDYQRAMKLLEVMGTRKASKILGISRSTLINWRHGKKPWLVRWNPKPSPELTLHIKCTTWRRVSNYIS